MLFNKFRTPINLTADLQRFCRLSRDQIQLYQDLECWDFGPNEKSSESGGELWEGRYLDEAY